MNVSSGQQAVAVASKWLGTPYQWGGGHAGPVPVGTPVDCSGLVDQVFGISGNTGTQVRMGSSISNLSSAGPGDLIFFGALAPSEPYHVGIYTGGGMMIDAPHTGTSVRRDTVAGFGTINAIRRLVPTTASGGGSTPTNPAGTGVQYNYAQLEAVWIQAGGNQQYMPMAAAIAMAESGGNANASNTNSNGSVDRGLWQINSSNGAGSSFDVMTNARAAVALSNNGINWRPWCTAYSDAACGTKGGTYLGTGSPYQRFYQVGIPPDMSAPINATNSAGGSAVLTSADLTSSGGGVPSVNNLGVIGCVLSPVRCSDSIVADAIKAVLVTVLTPLVQVVAGALGVGAGAVLMIFGIYEIAMSTQTGRQTRQTAGSAARLGAQVVAPESRLAGARVSHYEREMPSGQTRITTVAGRRRFWGPYRQRSTTRYYGVPTDQRGGPAPTSAPPNYAPPGTREILRGQAGSYRRQ